MNDLIWLVAAGAAAYLLWKKYGKPCCSGCAGSVREAFGPCGSEASAATGYQAKMDGFAPADDLGLDADLMIRPFDGGGPQEGCLA